MQRRSARTARRELAGAGRAAGDMLQADAYAAAATRLHASGDYRRAARTWRRLVAANECSAACMRGLAATCLALAGSGSNRTDAAAAARCAALALRQAEARTDIADGLSPACPHLRRGDVDFLLPHLSTPNASWRTLFNTASAGGPRPLGRGQGTPGKVFGLGLSKTGVTSLREALRVVGWRRTAAMGLDFYPRVVDSPRPTTEALRTYFAEVDASTDLPYALFAPELLRAFPTARFVLTTRHLHSWWPSVERQMAAAYPAQHPISRTRTLAYGHPEPHELLYKRRFVAHAVEVLRTVPCDRLLLLDLVEGSEGWQRLAPFLGVRVPDVAFPHLKPAPTPSAGASSPL